MARQRAVEGAHMRSGWFWGTDMWQQYLQEYAKTRPECLREWKSSPLANDHDFSEYVDDPAYVWQRTEHLSQVIDLHTHTFSDLRYNHRKTIERTSDQYGIYTCSHIHMSEYQALHAAANGGQPRNDATYQLQRDWILSNNGLLVMLRSDTRWCAAAYWIIYRQSSYFASGPSIERTVMHKLIWASLNKLREHGVRHVEIGQIDGVTQKEKNIAEFKRGFGGEAMPFTIVRKSAA